MNISEIRKLVKEESHYPLTVIKRDGKIVVRYDCESPRHVDMHSKTVCNIVKTATGLESTPNSYHGRKGLYVNYWAEAIIDDDSLDEILNRMGDTPK